MEAKTPTGDDDVIAKLAEERRKAEHVQIDENAGRHVAEAQLEITRAKYDELLARHLELVREVAMERPDVLARMACEVALSKQDAPNLFAMLAPDERERIQRIYPDLPSVIHAFLVRQESKNSGEQRISPEAGEFIRLSDWITQDAYFHNIPHWKFDQAKAYRMLYAFFDFHEDSFAHALTNACQLVYHGVPLYEHDEALDELAQIEFSNENYIYLSKKGEHYDQGPRASFPYWAKKYFMKRQHLEVHKIFFGGTEVGDPVQKIEILRTAFRHNIGFLQPNANETEGADHQVRAKSLQREAAQARWAPLKTVRDRTIEAYRAGKSGWKSRADAGRRLQHQVIAWAKDAGMPLSPENALDTIDKWLKESEQNSG